MATTKTTHTLDQLKNEKGFPVCFGGEKVNYTISGINERYYNNLDKNKRISYGFTTLFESVILEGIGYDGTYHYLVPLTEFERLGMIQPTIQDVVDTIDMEQLKSENKRLTEENVSIKGLINLYQIKKELFKTKAVTMKPELLGIKTIQPNPTESELDRKAWDMVIASIVITSEESVHIDFGTAYKIAQSFISHRQTLTNKGGEDASN